MVDYVLVFWQTDIFNKHGNNHTKYYENIILEKIS